MALVIPSDNYSFDASAKTLTLSAPFDNLGEEQIISIRNITKNQLVYDCEATSTNNISITSGVITFTYGGDMDDTDKMQIRIEYDYQNLSGIEITSIDGGTP